jgi:large subunit ribosomal protein L3
MGSGTNAARTWKGKKLPGQMGNVRKTVKGLKIVKVDEQKNLLLVKGSIPGAANGLVIIRRQA